MSTKNIERAFIPAKENRLFIHFFYHFSRYLLKHCFHSVYLDAEHIPSKNSSVLYFGNHHSWWDALIPLILNNKTLKQRPRAVMEWEQVDSYLFFRRIGCFSIDRDDPRSALKSLQYGIEWLNNERNTSLYLYPEGKISNPRLGICPFESGIGYMETRLESHVELVPLIQHSHQMYNSKPRLFIQIGSPIKRDNLPENKKEITAILESEVRLRFDNLVERASVKEPNIPHWKI
ncbi:MAG: lysophospholipid acyltransferase family protein [Balneolales bacterium]|nr:lysophospholipid acyltransferase family protein [Balneolales bacterium]